MKRTFFYPNNLGKIEKICLCGLFIAISMILNKVLAINYIPIIPFLRISLGGPALIIFSSLLLGPIYGMLVGGFSDIFGYLIFDIKAFAYMPQITLTYILLGFIPSFLFSLVKNIKNKKIMLLSSIIPMFIILIFVSVYFIYNDSLTLYGTTYNITLWMKIVIPISLFILFGVTIFFIIFIDKRMNKVIKDEQERKQLLNPYQIGFVCFLCEFFIMLLFGSLMKAYAFGFTMFLSIFICQMIVMFINIPLNIALISCIIIVGKKYFIKKY